MVGPLSRPSSLTIQKDGIITRRNASFIRIPALARAWLEEGGCGAEPSAGSRATRLPFCRGFAEPLALRRRLTLRASVSSSRPCEARAGIVPNSGQCVLRSPVCSAPLRGSRGAQDGAAAMRKAQSAFRADDEVSPEATNGEPLLRAAKRIWGAFHSASLRFWSIFPGFAHPMYAKNPVAVWTRRNSVRLW